MHLMLRGLPGAALHSPTGCIDLAQATVAHCAFALAVAELDQYSLLGAVAAVENRDACKRPATGTWLRP